MVEKTKNSISIHSPELLQIQKGNNISYGANQVWYSSWRARMSGCGPTATSNLIWYLAASRPETCGKLFAGRANEYDGMLRLMKTMWKYVTPGMKGVNKASMLTTGVNQYGEECGVKLMTHVLEVPKTASGRPTSEEVLNFLKEAFLKDLPVAFLNLSNGNVRNLDNWHWVTLISVDDTLQAKMYDQSLCLDVDLKQWLRSTVNGGAFVVIEPRLF